MRAIKKEEQAQELQALQAELGGKDSAATSPTQGGVQPQSPGWQETRPVADKSKVSAASAAVAAGDAVAVDGLGSSGEGSHDGAAVVRDVGAAAAEAVAGEVQGGELQAKIGCWARFKSRLPW